MDTSPKGRSSFANEVDIPDSSGDRRFVPSCDEEAGDGTTDLDKVVGDSSGERREVNPSFIRGESVF